MRAIANAGPLIHLSWKGKHRSLAAADRVHDPSRGSGDFLYVAFMWASGVTACVALLAEAAQ